MAIRIPVKPLGYSPRSGNGVVCENVDTAKDYIFPLNATGTPTKPWYLDGSTPKMSAGVPDTEVVALTGLNAPTGVTAKICQPPTGLNGWLKLYASGFYSYWPTDGDFVDGWLQYGSPDQNFDVVQLSITSVTHTPTGIDVQCVLPTCHLTPDGGMVGLELTISGPHFGVEFASDATNGGPNAASYWPKHETLDAVDIVPGSSLRPEFSVPIYYKTNDNADKQYGSLYLTGVDAPQWSQTITVQNTYTHYFDGGNITFHFECGYLENAPRYWSFVRTPRDGDTAYSREGAPTAISEEFVVQPGEKLTLSRTGSGTGITHESLYRSTGDPKLFSKVAEMAVGTTDITNAQDLYEIGGELPPYGNYTDFTATLADFLESSLIMPGNYALYLASQTVGGVTSTYVAPSDYGRFHAIPNAAGDYRWPIKLDEAGLALVKVNGGALVFTTTKVWLIDGGHPSQLTGRVISNEHPLKAKCGVTTIGGVAYWITSGGIAASAGGPPEIVTRRDFSVEDWDATYYTTTMGLSSLGGKLVLRVADASEASNPGLIIDTTDGFKATTFTTATTLATLKKPRYMAPSVILDKPTIVDYAQVATDAAVDLKIYADGSGYSTGTPPVATPDGSSKTGLFALATTRGPARRWAAEVTLSATPSAATTGIRDIILLERRIVTGQPVTVITPGMVDHFAEVRVRWDATVRIVAIIANSADGTTVYGKLYKSDGTTALTGTTNSAVRTFENGTPEYYDTTLEQVDYVVLKLCTDSGMTTPFAGQLQSLEIYTMQTVAASPGLRLINPGHGVPPWRYQEYVIGERKVLTGITPFSTSNSQITTASLYLNGSTTATAGPTIPANNGRTIPLATMQQISSIGFEFGVNDAYIKEIALDVQEPRMIGAEPVTLPGDKRNQLVRFADRGSIACAVVTLHGAATPSGSPATNTDYAGTFTLTPDLTAASAFLHTLAWGTSRYVIPIRDAADIAARTRDHQGEYSLWTSDLSVTGGLPVSVTLYPRRRVDMRGAKELHLTASDTGVHEWLYSRFDFGEAVTIAAIRVESSAGVTMNLWGDGSVGAATTKTITAGRQLLPPALGAFRCLDFDFNGEDEKINSVHIWLENPVPLGSWKPYNPDHVRGLQFQNESPVEIAAVRVEADAYTDMTLAMSADGTEVDFDAVTAGQQDKTGIASGLVVLPKTSGTFWEIDLDPAANDVRAFHILVRRTAIKGGGASSRPGALPDWLQGEFEFDGENVVSGLARVRTGTPDLYLAQNGGARAEKASNISDDVEFALSGLSGTYSLAADFNGDDLNVESLRLFPQEIIKLGLSGVILRGLENKRNWLNLKAAFRETGGIDAMRIVSSDYTGLSATVGGVTFNPASDDEFLVVDANDAELATAREWDLSIVRPAGAVISELHIYGRVWAALKNGRWRMEQSQDVPIHFWRLTADRLVRPRVGRILAPSYTAVTLALTWGGVAYSAVTVESGKIFHLPSVSAARYGTLRITTAETNQPITIELATGPDGLRA